MNKYDYLRKYIKDSPYFVGDGISLCNLTLSDKNKLNTIINKFQFNTPKSLKEFWNEIGYGTLPRSIHGNECAGENTILSPTEIADTLLYAYEDYFDGVNLILDDDGEEMILHKGYFPFFCISDSSHLLLMKVGEDGVYDFCERKLEDRLEDFIYNLYHIHPDYYDKLDYTPSTWQEMLEKEREDIENGVEFAREYYIAIEKYWHLGRHNRSKDGLFSSTNKPVQSLPD